VYSSVDFFILKEKRALYTLAAKEEPELRSKRKRYKTDGAMGGVVCLEFVPKDVANELLFVNAHN
jgi:hypothetical protein